MDKFDLKKFITEGKLLKEEKYTKIKDFDDYISGMYDASVDQEAEDGMQSGIWLKKEEGNPDEYSNTDVFDDLVDFLEENGKQTLEGNPDIVVNKDGEDIRWSAMVVGDESKSLKEDLADRAFELEMDFMDPSNKYGDKWQEEVAGVLLDKYEGEWENWANQNPEELGMLLDKFKSLKENKSLNELDSLSNVFDTITGEYEDEDEGSPTYGEVVFEEYKYHQVEDFIEEMYKKSRSVDDFIEQVTLGMTNTTSELSPEDQDKLYKWYDKKNWNGRKIRNNITNRTYRPVNENSKQQLKRGNEYSVLEPGMNEYLDNLEFIGYDSNEREYVFIDSTNISPGSNEVFFIKVPASDIESDVKPSQQDRLDSWNVRENKIPVNEERGEEGMVNGVNGKMHFFSEEDPDLGDIPNMRRYLGGDSGPYIQAHYGYVDYTIVKENSEYQLMKGHYNYGASADKNIYMIFDKNSKMLIDWEEWGYEELEKIYF